MGNSSSSSANSSDETVPNPSDPIPQDFFVDENETVDKQPSYWEMMKVVHNLLFIIHIFLLLFTIHFRFNSRQDMMNLSMQSFDHLDVLI